MRDFALRKADTEIDAFVLSLPTRGQRGVLIPPLAQGVGFVEPIRIEELRTINNSGFDLTKLMRICEELNTCAAGSCYFAIASLTRTILDHVPPVFSVNKFAEVANNYAGTKSFKESMQHLEESCRKIADGHLHTKIRSKETLPTFTQVNFSRDLDALLAEIIRILK